VHKAVLRHWTWKASQEDRHRLQKARNASKEAAIGPSFGSIPHAQLHVDVTGLVSAGCSGDTCRVPANHECCGPDGTCSDTACPAPGPGANPVVTAGGWVWRGLQSIMAFCDNVFNASKTCERLQVGSCSRALWGMPRLTCNCAARGALEL
jgi:hypothetical protein